MSSRKSKRYSTKKRLRTEIEIIGAESLKGRLKCLRGLLLVRVVEFGGEEDRPARNAGRLNSLADLLLVLVRRRGIDVRVAVPQRKLDRVLDRARRALPRSYRRINTSIPEQRTFEDVPRPTVGISAPVLSFTNLLAGIVWLFGVDWEDNVRWKRAT